MRLLWRRSFFSPPAERGSCWIAETMDWKTLARISTTIAGNYHLYPVTLRRKFRSSRRAFVPQFVCAKKPARSMTANGLQLSQAGCPSGFNRGINAVWHANRHQQATSCDLTDGVCASMLTSATSSKTPDLGTPSCTCCDLRVRGSLDSLIAFIVSE